MTSFGPKHPTRRDEPRCVLSPFVCSVSRSNPSVLAVYTTVPASVGADNISAPPERLAPEAASTAEPAAHRDRLSTLCRLCAWVYRPCSPPILAFASGWPSSSARRYHCRARSLLPTMPNTPSNDRRRGSYVVPIASAACALPM